MYTAFYGLREKPFALSPDPRFLYLAASHREALAHLLYGIEQGEGFISVTGEVGTGKTTLCRTLLERLEQDIELAFLFNPSKSALELLQSICAEFGLPAEGLGRRNLMSQLNKFLLEQKERGRRVLLIIDEAQTLSENTLEQVRLLSNLETSRAKLIHILLLGQPELDRKLDERGLRQLRQRISVRWKLDPLSADETVAYVRHRLSVAAGEPKDLFSETALREVHRRTGGIPRLVNQLCDRALLAGYASRAAQIGPALIRSAAREIPDVRDPGERDPRSGRPLLPTWMKRPWMYFALTLSFVALALGTGLALGRSRIDWLGRGSGGAGVGSESGLGADAGAFSGLDAAGRPAVSAGAAARGAGRGDGGDGSSGAAAAGANGRLPDGRPLVGRLIGYVDGSATGASHSSSLSSASGMPGTPSTGGAVMELRASDAALAAAGLDPRALDLAHAPAIDRSAVAPGVLGRLLAARTSDATLAESERAFLDLYDLEPDPSAANVSSTAQASLDAALAATSAAGTDPGASAAMARAAADSDTADTADALGRRLEARGLKTTAFDGGSLEMLRRLDHPVLIPVAVELPSGASASPAGAERRWLALTGFDGDRVWVAGLVAGRVVSVAQAEIAARWLEAGVLVWRNHESLAQRFERGGSPANVRWLQSALAELRYLHSEPTGRYDATTAEALRDFQHAVGLTEDGAVGPLTQIALYAQLDRYPVPRLSLASVRPAPDGPETRPAVAPALDPAFGPALDPALDPTLDPAFAPVSAAAGQPSSTTSPTHGDRG